MLSAATWILWWWYVAAICLILPTRFGSAVFGWFICMTGILAAINAVKVDLTGLPLTMLDLRIALADPAGLWDALSLPHWTRYAATLCVLLAIALVTIGGVVTLARSLRASGFRRGLLRAGTRLLCVLVIAALAITHLERVNHSVDKDNSVWEPESVAALSARIGIVPFLAYSQRVEAVAAGDFYERDTAATPRDANEIREAVGTYIDFTGQKDAGPLPNIVILMAESTFDPHMAFRLSGQFDSSLFTAGRQTGAVGPTRLG